MTNPFTMTDSITAERVAAELHDGAMQELTLARLQIDLLAAGAVSDPRLAAELNEIAGVLEDASRNLQELLYRLMPGPRLV
jgi:signal transduction histidine kinase